MSFLSIIELLLTGALAGLIAGFMGIGGGAVLTPLCILVYPAIGITDDNLVKIIFGTNMFLVMVFSMSATYKNHRNNNIDWRTVFIMGPLAIAGSIFGAWLASISNPAMLKKGFAALLVVSSLLIIIKGSTRPTTDGSSHKALIPLKFLPFLGFVAGTVGSLLGVGGGIIMVPSLILVFRLYVGKVAAISSSVIIFIGCAGMLSYMWHGQGVVDPPGWSTGYVWWSAAIPLALGGIPMAQVGALINSKLKAKMLQRVFGCILLIIAIKLLFF